MSLATKYRPKILDDVIGQESIKKILKRQIQLKQYQNCYIFNGASGCGKTTCARILANEINEFHGNPIEIDAASNNGVEKIKELIKSANERSIDSMYKIIIIDECHALTSQSWQAFLKCIEEPPAYTIFIFCTTEKHKIPDTIKNRCQIFNFNKINPLEIKSRLEFICKQEGFINFEESCDYISKISNGQVRDAISNLEKCASYSTDLSVTNALVALGDFSYNTYFALINGILDGSENNVLVALESVYNEGTDLKLFIDQFLDFCLDLYKTCIFQSALNTKIPAMYENQIKMTTQFQNADKYYSYYIDRLMELKNMLKNDLNPFVTVQVIFCKMCRLEK